MGLFSSSSKSTAVSNSTDAGTQTGDESVGVTVTGGNVTVASDTPRVLTYLAGTVGEVSGNILETSLDASLALQESAQDASRRQTDTASQLNLSLSEGIKELNLRSTETKAATMTARNLLVAAVLVVLALAFFLRRYFSAPAPTERKKNVPAKKSK